MTMDDNIPTFPTAQPPRPDEDTSTIDQVMEHVPGEIELDCEGPDVSASDRHANG
jgi:hypothetical protein